jgi:hypothetical protein
MPHNASISTYHSEASHMHDFIRVIKCDSIGSPIIIYKDKVACIFKVQIGHIRAI